MIGARHTFETGGRRLRISVPCSRHLALAFVISLGALTLQANTCAHKRLRISGPLCGRVLDPTGAVVSNIDLSVVDETGGLVADARSNSAGDFKFSPLPKGKYRLKTTAPGWLADIGEFEISQSNTSECKGPISVTLALYACGGGLGKAKPPHYGAS